MIKFFEENEAKKFDCEFHKKTINYQKNKNKSKCLCKNCDNYAVGSHAISKKSSLKHIADDKNKVLTFSQSRLSSNDNKLNVTPTIKEFGINESTTFNGFCTEHEKLFKNIDLNGINTKHDLIYQVYRNISYAYWKEKFIEVILKNKLDLLKKKVNLLDHLDTELLLSIFMEEVEKQNEKQLQRMYVLQDTMEDLEKFLYDFKDLSYLSHNEFLELDTLGLSIFYKKINIQIPVAMINDFAYLYSKKTISNIYFSVIPSEDATDIIMVTDKKSKDLAYNVWINSTRSNLDILNLIESMMIKSEYWFIKSDIINSMNVEKRNLLDLDIRYGISEHAFKFEYDMSIFDNLRLKLIKEGYYHNECDINAEINKITTIPKRKPKEYRESELMENIYSQFRY